MDYGDGTIIHFWNVEQKIEYTITLISKHILSYHRLKMCINDPQPCISLLFSYYLYFVLKTT